MMDNRPEFVWTFLGLAKIGAITAFINTSLKNRSLYHCLEIAKAKIYIIGSEHLSAASAMRDRMEGSNPEYPKVRRL
jgi:acyl-CoA synthetase (AMP-forming)/AMP-acid ligase II